MGCGESIMRPISGGPLHNCVRLNIFAHMI